MIDLVSPVTVVMIFCVASTVLGFASLLVTALVQFR